MRQKGHAHCNIEFIKCTYNANLCLCEVTAIVTKVNNKITKLKGPCVFTKIKMAMQINTVTYWCKVKATQK